MFAVGNILISDDLLEAPFACNLGACRGACCVQGDSGAPIEADERERLEAVLPAVRNRLRPEALRVIEEKGTWEEVAPGEFATTCVGGAECVFVTYRGPVASCAIHEAAIEGKVDWPKPISCHLYPIRIEDLGEMEALNYERVGICDPGIRHGRRTGIGLGDYLREPLVRRYGEAWYREFEEAIAERRAALGRTG
jgi:Fe-S-cluster containining protein